MWSKSSIQAWLNKHTCSLKLGLSSRRARIGVLELGLTKIGLAQVFFNKQNNFSLGSSSSSSLIWWYLPVNFVKEMNSYVTTVMVSAFPIGFIHGGVQSCGDTWKSRHLGKWVRELDKITNFKSSINLGKDTVTPIFATLRIKLRIAGNHGFRLKSIVPSWDGKTVC